jgi:chemotaxis protein methyltransferase CheR
MIYFDKVVREQLVDRFWKLLEPGGHLFVGHSESLTGSSHKFCYVQPAIYLK